MDHKLRWKRIRALWGRTNWKEIVSTFSGSISALERSFKTIEKSFSRHEVVSVFLQLSKTYEAPLTHCKSAKLHTLHIIIIIGCELKLDLFNLEVGLPRKYISCVKGSVRTGRLQRNGATLFYFISAAAWEWVWDIFETETNRCNYIQPAYSVIVKQKEMDRNTQRQR